MSAGRGSRGTRSGAALALVGDAAGRPRGRQAEPSRPAYVVLDALRHALDGAEWAPLHLTTGRSTRPASPRLPHALALHLAHAARLTADNDGAGALAPDRPRLAALLATDAARLDGALDALTRAGVVTGGPDRVRLASAVLGPAPRCAALDWAALAAATVGSPSAWVAAHALAERLERHHWTPVPRADLEQTLAAGASGARAALDRLVAGGVVERREQRGGVSVYRFADACWTDAPGPALGGAAVRTPRTPATFAAPTAPGPVHASAGAGPLATALPAVGLRLVVGGVAVEVPAGMRACVEVGADGRPTLTLLPGD